jgi:hypothetical protein
MDNSDAKVSKENGGPLEDIVQTENSNDPMNDSKWLEKSIHTKVTPVLPDDRGFSIDTTHDEKNTINFSGRSDRRKRTS